MPFAGFKNSPNRFAGFQTTKYDFEREVLLFSPLAKRFSLMGKSARRYETAKRTAKKRKKRKNEIQKIITPKSASRCYISGCAARIYNDIGNYAALL